MGGSPEDEVTNAELLKLVQSLKLRSIDNL